MKITRGLKNRLSEAQQAQIRAAWENAGPTLDMRIAATMAAARVAAPGLNIEMPKLEARRNGGPGGAMLRLIAAK